MTRFFLQFQRMLLAAAVVAAASGCSSVPRSANASVLTADAAADKAVRSPAGTADREALYRARLDSARVRFTSADVRFMTNMISHHAQALTMARLASISGAGASIQVLAARILNAQTDEIGIMQRWLRARDQPVPAVDTAAVGHMSHADAHIGRTMMPGMLTQPQLAQLASAQGATFDRLFLTFMIAHHKGAVVMVDELFATDGAGQDTDVFRFASDVQVDQRTEVARMELMLASLTSPSEH